MPVEEYRLSSGRRKRRVCGASIAAILNRIVGLPGAQAARAAGRLQVVIERPSPIPAVDGWQSAALTSYTFGVTMGVLGSIGLEPTEVLAVQWKSQMLLRNMTKDDSRKLAWDLLPGMAGQLRRKKDHGRAEALLIAAWAAMMLEQHKRKQAAALDAAMLKRANVVGGRGRPGTNADAQHQKLLGLTGVSD